MYAVPWVLALLPKVCGLAALDKEYDLDSLLNTAECKFGAKYKDHKLNAIVEDCCKTLSGIIKNNKEVIKQSKSCHLQFAESVSILLEFLAIKRADPATKRLVLYLTEAVRLLSESKEILKGLEDKNREINHIFDTMVYFNSHAKIQNEKTAVNTLRSSVKAFRNFIFAKIPIKRKNFVEDFLAIVESTCSDETMLVDNLRVLAKISELEKIASRIVSNPATRSLIGKLLASKSDYVLSGCLQLIGNCLAVSSDFGGQLYTPATLQSLLKIFERFCSKVS